MDVWPFPPQSNLTESIQWQTEIIRAKSAEQRICLRNAPRTVIEYNYHLLPSEVEAATILARGFGADNILLPFWHELKNLVSLIAGQSSISIDTTTSRYLDSGFAFIMGQDGVYEIVTIESVNPSSIDIASPYLVNSYSKAVIMPCHSAKFKEPFQLRKYAAEYFTSNTGFILCENFNLTGVNNYPSYNSSYVLTDRPLISAATETHSREFTPFDSIAGPTYYSKNYNYPISKSTQSWSFNSKAEEWAHRLWLYTVKGKLDSFYAPRWTRDFILDSSFVSTDTSLLIQENTILADSYIGHIAIIKRDGTHIYKEVTGWSSAGPGQLSMDLSSQVGETLSLTDIELITRMPVMRFNSDNQEFLYTGTGVVDMQLPMMETPA